MNHVNFDKLARIKQKYGYSTQISTLNQPKSQFYIHKKPQSQISCHIQQKIQSSRIKQQKYFSEFQISNQGSKKKQNDPATSLYNQNPRYSNSKNRTFRALELMFEVSNNQNILQQTQKVSQNVDVSNKVNQNFVESYEKTYDLLKNYRQKIKSAFLDQQQNQKILQINSKKQNGKVIDKQNQSPVAEYSNGRLQRVNQNIINLSQNQKEHQIVKESVKTRHNLFEGIDVNKIDLKTELRHIQQLQNKIQYVLGLNLK